MNGELPLSAIGANDRALVVDQVFLDLYSKIVSMVLVPGTKLSEVEVAKAMAVSRQPVRDAFFRLSKLGFLEIRPQRGTIVSLISKQSVTQAAFIRMALEIETVRKACDKLSDSDMDALEEILKQQKKASDAGDKKAFHELDDLFHRQICERAGLGFVWSLIREQKAHMDRVRILSLDYGCNQAFEEHQRVFFALRARNEEQAVSLMRNHLTTILQHTLRISTEHTVYFADES